MPIYANIVSKFDDAGVLAANSAFGGLGKSFSRMAAVGAAAFAALSVAAGYFAVDAMKAADESARVGRTLENAAKNSGAFGQTAKDIKNATKQIEDFTQALALTTGISDETYNALATTFLAAPKIAAMGTSAVNKLVATASDIAATTGKDLESVGTALAKALENPETAVSKLRRANIFLSDAQKNTYDSMLDVGDQAGAQKYLIDELAKSYAGAAEAAASPWAKLNETFQWMKELVGTELLKAIEPLIPTIQAMVAAMVEDPRFIATIQQVAQAFVDLTPSVLELLPTMLDLGLTVLPLVLDGLKYIMPLVSLLTDFLGSATDALLVFNEQGQGWIFWVGMLSAPLGILVTQLQWLLKQFESVPTIFGMALGPIGQAITLFTRWKDIINQVSDAWDRMVSKFKTPVVGPNGQFDFGKAFLRTAGLPFFADGGIVTGPTLGVIGEAGPEAVIPLDRLRSTGSGGPVYNISINGGLSTSAEIGQMVVSAIKRYEKANGAVFQAA